jgi:2,4-dienoyl-CoA reductase-like NADH-dependent reductase (Old Yellow Enzyme family)
MILKKFKINKIQLQNRIVVSPMCQYSAVNGSPSNWHYNHLQNLSSTGAGMVILESTAINKEAKITHSDLCLFNNSHERNLKKLISFLKRNNATKYGIQISHSGRKGSSFVPWIKKNCPLPASKSWTTLSASPISRDKNWPKPNEMSKKQINNLIKSFKKTALRAKRINFDCLEIHMAHGYLLHQFFSPLSNVRTDDYGGSFKNRSKLLIEVTKEIRKIWPKNRILGARITGSDHMKNGLSIKDAVRLAKNLKKVGVDYVSVSSGGIVPVTKMNEQEGFRSKMASIIKKESKITTTTSGMFTKHSTVVKLINDKKIDFITIARIIIKNPRWIYELAKKEKLNSFVPDQYKRIL